MIQEAMICIISQNRKLTVLFYNFTIILFNFIIQEAYDIVKYGFLGKRDEGYVLMITLGASEMFLTSAL